MIERGPKMALKIRLLRPVFKGSIWKKWAQPNLEPPQSGAFGIHVSRWIEAL